MIELSIPQRLEQRMESGKMRMLAVFYYDFEDESVRTTYCGNDIEEIQAILRSFGCFPPEDRVRYENDS